MKTDPTEEGQAAHREQCYVCRRAKVNCLCGSIKPFATRMRVVILMHYEEARAQKTGTARLAKLCLTNSELLVGTDFTRDERVNALLRDPAYAPFVLYPGAEAVDFKTAGKELLPEGKTPLVFVVDGTWRSARQLLKRSQNILALPKLSFSGEYVSRFAIKQQPMKHCVSTIEAVYYLCKEAEEAGFEKLDGQNEVLLALLKKLVDTQFYYKQVKGRRREENQKLKKQKAP